MGRKRRRIIKPIKKKLPSKYFECPSCFTFRGFGVRIDKKNEKAFGVCHKCGIEIIIPLLKTIKGKIATAFISIDYYNEMCDTLRRIKAKLLEDY